MSRLNELSDDEIKFLEVVACCGARFIPRESRDAINHVLEIVQSENKDEAEPKPKFKRGDWVRFNHFGELKAGVVTDIFNNEYKVETGDDIYFVLEEALTLDTKPQSKVKVGDRIITKKGMGTAKIVSDDGRYVGWLLDNGEWYINLRPEKEEKQPAEESEGKLSLRDCVIKTDEANQHRISLEVDYTAYRMELAKAVAIAYAEEGRYEPWAIGAKAVEVADGVIDELKKKQQ